MSLDTLKDLFVDQLLDVYDAEQQLAEALPRMAEGAKHKQLQQAFKQHLKETKEHAKRLESVFDEIDMDPESEPCAAMQGLLEEGEEILDASGDASVRDAALIAAAQRVEHYEISAYGTLRTLAHQLGLDAAAEILQQTLDDEKATDARLNEIALQVVNPEAGQTGQDPEGKSPKGRRGQH